MTVLLDTSILIALMNAKEGLHGWSTTEFRRAKQKGPTAICDIVYCEASVALPSKADIDAVVGALSLERVKISDDALFRAGKAFLVYRRNRGLKPRMLPDFLIGAVAEETQCELMTNNADDFRKYFPSVQLIVP